MNIDILILEEDGSFTVDNKETNDELDALKWSSRFLGTFKGDPYHRAVRCIFNNKILTYNSEMNKLTISNKNPYLK